MKTTAITPRKSAQKDQSRDSARLSMDLARESQISLPANGRAEFMTKLKAASSGRPKLKLTFLGFSLDDQGADAQARRALLRELGARGHDVVLMQQEHQSPTTGATNLDRCKTLTFGSITQLKNRHVEAIRDVDAVIIGSEIIGARGLCEWVLQNAGGAVAFHDLDVRATLASLEAGDGASADLLRNCDLYLPQVGGPDLRRIEGTFKDSLIRPFYAAVDTSIYYPDVSREHFNLGYIGDYTESMQPGLDELLLEPARNWEQGSFIVAGSGYPRGIRWPGNVRRRPQPTPNQKRSFYCSQDFALCISTEAMLESGCSPAPSLFEAAACGTPIISEYWDGIESFFEPQEEILVSHSSEETLYYLLETTHAERTMLSKRARARVLSSHTAKHRAAELETHICDVLKPGIITGKSGERPHGQP